MKETMTEAAYYTYPCFLLYIKIQSEFLCHNNIHSYNNMDTVKPV